MAVKAGSILVWCAWQGRLETATGSRGGAGSQGLWCFGEGISKMNENSGNTIEGLWSKEQKKRTIWEVFTQLIRLLWDGMGGKVLKLTSYLYILPQTYANKHKFRILLNTCKDRNSISNHINATAGPLLEVIACNMKVLLMFTTFHFVIYDISAYQCQNETKWVKLSPNKCLIIFLWHSATTFTTPYCWKYFTHKAPQWTCGEWYMRLLFSFLF